MWRFFGYENPEKPIQVEETAENLDQKLNKMQKMLKECTVKADMMKAQAIQLHQRGDKIQARDILSQRNQQLATANLLSRQIANLSQTQSTLHRATLNDEIFQAMKDSDRLMAQQMGRLDIDEVQEVQQNLNKKHTDVSDMGNILATPFDVRYGDDDFDDTDALLAEWDEKNAIDYSQEIDALLPNLPERNNHYPKGKNELESNMDLKN